MQTTRHLKEQRVDKGWSCLEVGGGSGSIASWLCARVGDHGRVKPGGWIVLEEIDDLSIVPDSSVNPGEEELQVRRAVQHVLASRGVELRYGRLLPQKLHACGLVNVGAEASVFIWRGHSPGTSLLKLTCEELRDPIIATGLISQSEFDAEMKRVDERDFLMPSPMLWTAWGQIPARP